MYCGGVQGNGAAGSGPRRCASALETRAGCPATCGETSATLAAYGMPPGPFIASPCASRASFASPGRARLAWRAGGVPLKRWRELSQARANDSQGE